MTLPQADRCDPQRLLELVRGGEPSALDTITRCYGERLLSAGRRHCRTSSEADDAVQETLLIAATELGSFRGEGSLEGFLVRIVARTCRRISRGRKNDAALHETDVELAAEDDSPERLSAQHELGAALNAILLSLDPKERAILLLAELEDYTAPEIAAELGLTAGAVRTRLTRLRQRLRDRLAAFADPGEPFEAL